VGRVRLPFWSEDNRPGFNTRFQQKVGVRCQERPAKYDGPDGDKLKYKFVWNVSALSGPNRFRNAGIQKIRVFAET
jgi:hypothetical protein